MKLTHEEITQHGSNIIELLMEYCKKSKLSTYSMMVVFVEIIKMLKVMCHEEMERAKKRDS